MLKYVVIAITLVTMTSGTPVSCYQGTNPTNASSLVASSSNCGDTEIGNAQRCHRPIKKSGNTFKKYGCGYCSSVGGNEGTDCEQCTQINCNTFVDISAAKVDNDKKNSSSTTNNQTETNTGSINCASGNYTDKVTYVKCTSQCYSLTTSSSYNGSAYDLIKSIDLSVASSVSATGVYGCGLCSDINTVIGETSATGKVTCKNCKTDKCNSGSYLTYSLVVVVAAVATALFMY